MLSKKLFVVGVCLLSLSGIANAEGGGAKAMKLTSLDISELQAVCQATQEKLNELESSGKVKLSKDSGAFDCLKNVEQQYEMICSSGAADCERYASGGFIYWMWGAEVDLPNLQKFKSRNLRFDARGVFGLSAIHVQEGGTGLSHWRFSVVFQPTISIVKDSPARLALGPDPKASEPDLFQIVRRGMTFVLLPKGSEADLTVSDLYAQGDELVKGGFSELKKVQLGAFWEGKLPYQTTNNQTLIVLSANASGIVRNIEDAATLKGFVSLNNTALFVNIYSLQGEFQPHNRGVQANEIIELFTINM